MSHVRTSLRIAAPPERVWAVLTDFAAYPQWNSVISQVQAEPREGGSMRFRIQMDASPELAFRARFVRWAPNRELAWRGGAPLVPALAWGEHYFRLAPIEDDTQLTHGEDFGGLLGLVMQTRVRDRVIRTYEGFNQALKRRVEALARGES